MVVVNKTEKFAKWQHRRGEGHANANLWVADACNVIYATTRTRMNVDLSIILLVPGRSTSTKMHFLSSHSCFVKCRWRMTCYLIPISKLRVQLAGGKKKGYWKRFGRIDFLLASAAVQTGQISVHESELRWRTKERDWLAQDEVSPVLIRIAAIAIWLSSIKIASRVDDATDELS